MHARINPFVQFFLPHNFLIRQQFMSSFPVEGSASGMTEEYLMLAR